MELLESQDPEKIRLIETSDRHKKALEKEVKLMSDNTGQIVKNALVIGGVLAVSYVLVNQLSSGKKKKSKLKASAVDTVVETTNTEEDTPSAFHQLASKVADTATLFLLELAKDALAEYLNGRQKKDAES